MSIVGLLVALIVLCAVYWIAMRVLKAFGVGDPIATIVQVIIVIIALVWLLSAFGVNTGIRVS